MKGRELKKRLRKDRLMNTISLRMPEDVVEDLKLVAPHLGFSGYTKTDLVFGFKKTKAWLQLYSHNFISDFIRKPL